VDGTTPFLAAIEWGPLSAQLPTTTGTCGTWQNLNLSGSVQLAPNATGFAYEFEGTGDLAFSANAKLQTGIEIGLCITDPSGNVIPMIGGGMAESTVNANDGVRSLSVTNYEGITATTSGFYSVGICIQPVCPSPTAPALPYPLGLNGGQFAWGGGVVYVRIVPNSG
jgi:hypothetical protein